MQIDIEKLKLYAANASRGLFVRLAQNPRLLAVLPVLAGILAVVFICFLKTGKLFAFQAVWYLPVPLFFYLFLRLLDNQQNFYQRASARAANISASGFFLALFCSGVPHIICLLTGILAAICIFVHPHTLRRSARYHPAAASVALVGGLSGVVYFFIQKAFWKTLAAMSAKLVYAVLHFFIPLMAVFPRGARPKFLMAQVAKAGGPPPATFRVHHSVPRRVFHRPGPGPGKRVDLPPPPKPKGKGFDNAHDFMAVASDHFTLKIAFFQNISAGICLFVLLLCMELLLSGRSLGRGRMLKVLLGGIAAVIIINALAMTLYFAICHVAMTPGFSPTLAMLSKKLVLVLSSPLVSFMGYLVLCVLVLRWFLPDLQMLKVARLRPAA